MIRLIAPLLLATTLGACGENGTDGVSGASDRGAAAQLRNQVTLSRRPPGSEVAAGAKIFVVSGDTAEKSAGGIARVKVTVKTPGNDVLLVLTSGAQVQWEVVPAEGTKIAGVILSAEKNSTLQMEAPAPAWTVRLPYTEKAEGSDLKSLQAELNKYLDVGRIDILRASKTIPASVEIAQADARQPPLAYQPKGDQEIKGPVFELVTSDYRLSKWSFDGPIVEREEKYVGEGKVAVSPSGAKVYLLAGDGLTIIDKASGTRTTPPLPDNFPRFSWAMDLTYDTKRNYVTIVSLGGEGFLYRYDAAAGKWADVRSVNNFDFNALAYNAQRDLYFAWTTDNKLLQISGEGEPLRSDDITDKLWGWSGIAGDKGRGNQHVVSLVGAGKELAIVAIEAGQVKRIWRYDSEAQSASIAFRGK